MSKLLLDEKPIVVLPSLARAVGINGAVILQQLHYWLQRSNNLKEGYIWRYQSYEGWAKELGWITASCVKKIISKLEVDGLIISSNFNTLTFDKTKWYRINYEHPLLVERLENTSSPTMGQKVSDDKIQSTQRWDKKCATIPEITPKSTTDINTNTVNDTNFDNFWNAYPRKVAKGDARKAWKALKPSEELAFEIIESVKQQAQSLESWKKDNGKFIPYPATWLRAERWNDEILGEAYDPEPKQLLSEDEIAEVLWGHLSPAQLEKEKAKEMKRREAKAARLAAANR